MAAPLSSEEERTEARLWHQVLSFLGNTALALVSWGALMAVGYALNPPAASQGLILIASVLFPAVVGLVINRFRQDEMATVIWLTGLIWILIVALWILDMPTGPNQCMQCGATEKLTRTFFSFPQPSGLIDDDGPFICTWPAAALVGYAIGARLALRRKKANA